MILEVHMPGPSAFDLQDVLVKLDEALPIICITGRGDISMSGHADLLIIDMPPKVRGGIFDRYNNFAGVSSFWTVSLWGDKKLPAEFRKEG